MKNLFFIGAIVIVLFGGLFVAVQYQKSQEEKEYYNQVNPYELENQLRNGGDATVYFYSPKCPYCKKATPIVNELTEQLGIDLKKVNVHEYEEAWDIYSINATPTIIHYKEGNVVSGIEGLKSESEYRQFFYTYVLNDGNTQQAQGDVQPNEETELEDIQDAESSN